MITLNYIPTPSVQEDNSKWTDGKCISIDEGTHVTFFIDHYTEENSEGEVITRAFPIRVAKPVKRDLAINAAEMEAYGLTTAMQVASFNASLARKSRENIDDEEVKEHDSFIEHVKEELTKLGI
jgi:hypothetical protein